MPEIEAIWVGRTGAKGSQDDGFTIGLNAGWTHANVNLLHTGVKDGQDDG